MSILLVGAGYMAKEYAKVLNGMKLDYTVVGRSQESVNSFREDIGKNALEGGLESVFSSLSNHYDYAIVATTVESLENNTLFLINNGIKNILVEKPAALSYEKMNEIAQKANEKNVNVYIAYNRRFYASVLNAKKIIEQEGGLQSFLFEFTEWSHVVGKLNKTKEQLNNWFIGNSSHVLDTAFFFGGKPKEISTFIQSKLDWHPKGSIYSGAGLTEENILFSYHANWTAPGSWKLELLTQKNRYIFRPFEKLHVQTLGSIDVIEVPIDDLLDTQYKPGLFKQTESFLKITPLTKYLLNIKEGLELMKIYERINGGQ
ncbi:MULTISPECIES: Gfo/Idh/MocA family protein [unclassified Viridibacillus]|uniref:Gfo/Idh/MocA family protein n=1 Tax=unclassified Viridibacillus TaxID=2617942 RepID=UPI00096CCCB8|nr:Gfo/Idh/MocA family oxidoreductase [Viridibacillus sp. FSL H8-0123]OMC81693.1 hypothetical protein BK130_13570 [Viridibacillus sp. FSL H8-0123]